MKSARMYIVFILLMFSVRAVLALQPALYSIIAGQCATKDEKIKITWCYNYHEISHEASKQIIPFNPIYASAANPDGKHTVFDSAKEFSIFADGNLHHLIIHNSDCKDNADKSNCYISHDADYTWDIYSMRGGYDSDDEEVDGQCGVIYKGVESLSKCDDVVKDGYVKTYSQNPHRTIIRIPIN